MACDKGYSLYEGNCSSDQKPEQAKPVDVAGTEKPRHSQQPEWETGEVKADTPQSLMYKDADEDREIKEAGDEGKKAAGIK